MLANSPSKWLRVVLANNSAQKSPCPCILLALSSPYHLTKASEALTMLQLIQESQTSMITILTPPHNLIQQESSASSCLLRVPTCFLLFFMAHFQVDIFFYKWAFNKI